MVQMKFSSDDPYVLAAVSLTASSHIKSDLTVILIENDQVHSTNVFLRAQATTNSAANPVSAVTAVGNQAIGAGVSDGTIEPDGNPNPRPDRPPGPNPD